MFNVSPSFRKKVEQVRAQRIAAGLLTPDPPPPPRQMLAMLIDMRPERQKVVKQPKEVVREPLCVATPVANEKPPEPTDDAPPKSIPTMRQIISACAAVYGVSYLDIISARRTGDVIWPRQVAMYLAKEMTQKSLPQIGLAIGRRDHTTVLHAVRKITGLIKTDVELRQRVDEARSRLL
jgi:hypothetical protein